MPASHVSVKGKPRLREVTWVQIGTRSRPLILGAGLCALGFALVHWLPGIFYREFSAGKYLVFHTVFEFASVVVSFTVSVIGWHGYRQNANKRDLVIGIVFLATGLIDFMHTLSYEGMPAFLSPNSVSKACTYWIAARLTDAIGLFAAAFVAEKSKLRLLRPSVLAAVGILWVAGLAVSISYFPHLLPQMFIPGTGLTPLKIHLEWTVIVLYAGAIWVFGLRGGREPSTVMLQLALMVGILSEFSFTLYASAFDTYNLLGHLYKVIAYYLIFRALFLSSLERPYNELMKARNQIEQSFSQIGTALASSLNLDEVLQLIAKLSADMLRSRHAAVILVRDGRMQIQAQSGMLKHPIAIPAERTSAGAAAVSTKRPVVIRDVRGIHGHSPGCRCQQLDGPPARSVVSAPIIFGEEVLGVVEVYSPDINAFGQREAELLSSFARQAAVAIRNSIVYEQERTVAEVLQRSLLPDAPSVSCLDIAVRYVPAEDSAKVGGDLYDVFALDAEHLAVVIGDVCGHGLEAASMTAMTVYTIKGFLLHGMSPGEALRHTNLTLCRSGIGERLAKFVTVFLAVLNTKTFELSYSNAGHHMPIVYTKGCCEVMDLRPGLPLAVDESAYYETCTAELQGAECMLLYTDGILEARRQGEFFGEEKLCGLCADLIDRRAEEMLDGIVEHVREWSGILEDDIAMLVVK